MEVNSGSTADSLSLSPAVARRYTAERLSAEEAQRCAEFIAWGPVAFQVSRLMVERGVLAALRSAPDGLSRGDIAERCDLSAYAATVLLEASLSIGTVLVDAATGRYTLSKMGWFLLTDAATRVNLSFCHDVCYKGLYHLDDALASGTPAGLKELGPWSTIYEGLSLLPPSVQDSWFAFDHFYSDAAFPAALPLVFSCPVGTLYDVGGNTGKFALRCVDYDPAVSVTVLDLAPQIALLEENIADKAGSARITGYAIDFLDAAAAFPPSAAGVDVIWMSQFLDCFSMPQIVSILRRATAVMTANTRLCIMETLWDRQRYESAALCLTMTSLYFAALANGNSKMYSSADLFSCLSAAGLTVESLHDHLGQGHTLLICKKS